MHLHPIDHDINGKLCGLLEVVDYSDLKLPHEYKINPELFYISQSRFMCLFYTYKSLQVLVGDIFKFNLSLWKGD